MTTACAKIVASLLEVCFRMTALIAEGTKQVAALHAVGPPGQGGVRHALPNRKERAIYAASVQFGKISQIAHRAARSVSP